MGENLRNSKTAWFIDVIYDVIIPSCTKHALEIKDYLKIDETEKTPKCNLGNYCKILLGVAKNIVEINLKLPSTVGTWAKT